MVTTEQLLDIIPGARVDEQIVAGLNDALTQFLINTPRRIGGFLAQVAHECNKFRTFTEYASGAEYEGRKDLGNTEPGDGVRFKGRGAIQVTGRLNYIALSHYLNMGDQLVENPGRVALPDLAFLSAGWYWYTRNLNAVCDRPEDWVHSGVHHYNKIEYMTLLVNGGQNGIKERTFYYMNARKVLSF